MAWTRDDGWVWVFACVDHYTAEAWAHVARVGCGRGPRAVTAARLGTQYRSAHFLGSIGWLGIADDAAFLGEPETNGCAERWIRTLKEQCLWAELHDTVDQLRQAVSSFVDRYNTSWLIQRHGHLTPRRRIRQLEHQQRHDQVWCDIRSGPTGRTQPPRPPQRAF